MLCIFYYIFICVLSFHEDGDIVIVTTASLGLYNKLLGIQYLIKTCLMAEGMNET